MVAYPFHPLAGQTVLVTGSHEHNDVQYLLSSAEGRRMKITYADPIEQAEAQKRQKFTGWMTRLARSKFPRGEGGCMTKLFQVLRRLVIFIRIRVGNLVGKDVRLGFLNRWLRQVRRQAWRQLWRGLRDRFRRYRAHGGLLSEAN